MRGLQCVHKRAAINFQTAGPVIAGPTESHLDK